MKYVAQQHPLGCLIASVAMVLDMTYEQVAETIPLQDMEELEKTGVNRLGLIAYDRIEELARSRNIQIVGSESGQFVCEIGLRYLAVFPADTDPLMTHTVAIDEMGLVFDPDPVNEHVRGYWSSFDFLGMMEFRPASNSASETVTET